MENVHCNIKAEYSCMLSEYKQAYQDVYTKARGRSGEAVLRMESGSELMAESRG